MIVSIGLVFIAGFIIAFIAGFLVCFFGVKSEEDREAFVDKIDEFTEDNNSDNVFLGVKENE